MKSNSKLILREVLWLTVSLILTILLALLLIGHTFLNETLYLHLHDTYFVLSRSLILPPLFFFTTFAVHLIATFKKKFTELLANWGLLISGSALIITLTLLIKSFSKFAYDWTLFPPLSALGPDKIPQLTEDPTTKVIVNFLTVAQIIISVVVIYLAYHLGTKKRHNP